MSKKIQILLILFFFNIQILWSDSVGLLIMATGKYICFVPPLIASAKKHFCRDHQVTFFVFTDAAPLAEDDVICIPQKRLGWPYDTLMRFHAYAAAKDLLLTQDYLFACDADMLFVDDVGDEILSERVATLHPGFVHQRGSYETDPISKAYVAGHEGEHYFAGGFYGGSASEVIRIAETCADRIDEDLRVHNYIAVWHDESHWNRYCIDFKPTLILTPSYCFPESWNLPYQKRLLALDKDHKEFQLSLHK